MSARMKKRHIEIKINGESYQVSQDKAQTILALVSSDFIPWREVAKNELRKKPEYAVMLKGARLKEGYTQVELAKKVGIHQYNLSKMEQGKRPLGKEMAKRIARVLKVDHRIFL